MTSIYSRLFRSRFRPEDFLTEALVDLLNRPELCHTPVIKDFLQVLLRGGIGDNAALDRLLQKVGSARHCSWVRSPPLKYDGATKLPDIGLCDGSGRPFVLIEAKIGAGFTQHRLRTPEEEESENRQESRQLKGQLEVYDKALTKENPDGVCGLILLTHSTEAPMDFLSEAGPYRSPCRAVSRWHSVQKWLSDRELASSLESSLSKELSVFLEEKGLAQMEKKDIRALGVVLADRLHNRLVELFKQTRANLKVSLGLDDAGFGEAVKASRPIAWDWGIQEWYYPFGKSKQWYIAWGLVPAASLGLDSNRDNLHALVYVGKEQKGGEGIPTSAPLVHGWQRGHIDKEGDYLFTSIAAEELFNNGDFSNEFVTWLKPRIKAGMKTLDACRRKSSKAK
jgi:hypothetical protein